MIKRIKSWLAKKWDGKDPTGLVPEDLHHYIRWQDYHVLIIPIAGFAMFVTLMYMRDWPRREAELEERRKKLEKEGLL